MKPAIWQKRRQNYRVAPHAGAWIETISTPVHGWVYLVTPHAGACGSCCDSEERKAAHRTWQQMEEGSEVVTFCHGLKLVAADGKKYETDCANTGVPHKRGDESAFPGRHSMSTLPQLSQFLRA